MRKSRPPWGLRICSNRAVVQTLVMGLPLELLKKMCYVCADVQQAIHWVPYRRIKQNIPVFEESFSASWIWAEYYVASLVSVGKEWEGAGLDQYRPQGAAHRYLLLVLPFPSSPPPFRAGLIQQPLSPTLSVPIFSSALSGSFCLHLLLSLWKTGTMSISHGNQKRQTWNTQANGTIANYPQLHICYQHTGKSPILRWLKLKGRSLKWRAKCFQRLNEVFWIQRWSMALREKVEIVKKWWLRLE